MTDLNGTHLSSIILTRIAFTNVILRYTADTIPRLRELRRVHSSWYEDVMTYMDEHWSLLMTEKEFILLSMSPDRESYKKARGSTTIDFQSRNVLLPLMVTDRNHVMTFLLNNRLIWVDENLFIWSLHCANEELFTRILEERHGPMTEEYATCWFGAVFDTFNKKLYKVFVEAGVDIFRTSNGGYRPTMFELIVLQRYRAVENLMLILKLISDHEKSLECYLKVLRIVLGWKRGTPNKKYREEAPRIIKALLDVPGLMDTLKLEDIIKADVSFLEELHKRRCPLISASNATKLISDKIFEDSTMAQDVLSFLNMKGLLGPETVLTLRKLSTALYKVTA